jgi:WD40 repeat protein/uncharacterized caspase-like protein
MLPPVPRPWMQSLTHALLATLVVTGCSVTVQPIRSRGRGGHSDATAKSDAAIPVVNLEPLTPELPVASCPEQAPPPVLDSTAKFVLQNGHERLIRRIAVSADGRTLASASDDGTVNVWDVRNGILVRRVMTGGTLVSGLSLSADGKRLAYYAPDGSPEGLAIRIVDLDRETPPRTITPQYGSFELSSDGKKLAIAPNSLMIFDVDSGALLHDVQLGLKMPMVLDVAFDETDARIAIAGRDEVVIADVAKGTILHRLPTNYSSLNDMPGSIVFAKDRVLIRSLTGVITPYVLGKTAALTALAGTYKDMAVAGSRLWAADMRKGNVSAFALPNLTPIELPAVNAAKADVIAASDDESTVVFATGDYTSGSFIDARDAETMRPVRTIEGHALGVEVIALNPAGDELVTGATTGELGRWNLRDGSRAMPLPEEERDHSGMVSIDYAPNGEFFAVTNGSYMARVRDAKTGRTLRRWAPKSGYHLRFMKFLPKTSDLMTVAMNIERKLSPTKKDPNGQPHLDETYDVFVDRWDLSGPKPPLPKSPTGTIAPPAGKSIGQTTHQAGYIALSPNGDLLALGSPSEIALMRLSTGAIAWTTRLETRNIFTSKQIDGALEHQGRWITFSPDGKTLLLSTRRYETNAQGVQSAVPSLLVFDTSNGRLTSTHRLDTYGPVAWRHGKIVVGGTRPVLVDASTMAVRARINAPDNNITTVTLHPTRDLFVIGGDGGGTSFVNEQGGITATLVSTPNGEWIAAAPDGAYHSSIDGARALAWSFTSPLEGFSFERFAARFDKPDVVAKRLLGEASPANVSLARPPRLQVNSAPRGVVRTPDRSLTIATTASSASRVDRVRAFVDGRPVAEQLVCAREGNASLTVPLHAGQNRVGLVAYDAAGQASNTQNIDVVSTSPLAERPNLYVVAIGVSRYPNMSADQQLDFADDDARSVTESFQRQVGPGKPFAKVFTTTLIDDKVTVASVEKAIASLRVMRPDDLGVVFFAGHGAKLAEGQMVFMTSQAAFTRTSAETFGVGWDKIHAGLGSVRGRILMMLDACHSGYLTTEVVAPNEDLARQLTAGGRAGVFVFSAARGSQFSFEVPREGMTSASRGLELAWTGDKKPPPMSRQLPGGHGLFTSALLEALAGDAPDRDRSGATEVGELVDYVTERVRAASNGKQTPWVARREMFGEFIVVPAKP